MKSEGQRLFYVCFASAVLLASLLPAWADPYDDAYPFSTYPMFATKRDAPLFVIAEGHRDDKQIVRIEPKWLGTDEVMQAAATLRKAAEDRSRAHQLCKQIAARLPASEGIKKVRIVQAKYEPISYFTEGPRPLMRKVIASCRVGKRDGANALDRIER